jgi:hypothetical protein
VGITSRLITPTWTRISSHWWSKEQGEHSSKDLVEQIMVEQPSWPSRNKQKETLQNVLERQRPMYA